MVGGNPTNMRPDLREAHDAATAEHAAIVQAEEDIRAGKPFDPQEIAARIRGEVAGLDGPRLRAVLDAVRAQRGGY